MKYLHDDRLAELTSVLTDCALGGAVSQRVLNGRIEAYTMKRGTGDKKYAFKLGEKYVASLEQRLEEEASYKRNTLHQKDSNRRKRSQSTGDFEESLLDGRDAPLEPTTKRSRASSFDATRSQIRAAKRLELNRNISSPVGAVPSALGDFAALGTRRLMVGDDEPALQAHIRDTFSHYSCSAYTGRRSSLH